MTYRTVFSTLMLLAMLGVAGSAQAQRIERMPGYFDFDELERIVGAETTLEVNVKGALLRMAAEAARIEDDTLADMLLKLVAIQVRGYTLDYESREVLRDRVGPLARKLSEDGWDRVVRVSEDGEFVEMLVRDTSGERVEGMMVFVIQSGDNGTVFVNIVGEIDPEDIGRIGRRFRIDVLEDL
ncbi:MAG: DUF4252 domain-containing protein [Rhodothermales bacterium]|nr:DUF4252 domain-containing protein [Rhodothermales bacterium]MBO6778213.1 DUF4252 domain-containing protein [Rhodothermales bacterium]